MKRLLSAVVLVGCAGTSSKSPAGPSGGTDTSVSDDTASAVDSADTADSGGSDPSTVTLSGTTAVPESTESTGPLAVSAVHLTFDNSSVTLGLSLDTVPLDEAGAFTLTLPDPPPQSHLSALSPSDHPEVSGALYALPVFVPDNPDSAAFYEGQTMRGMPFDRFAVWLDPDSVGDTGWPGGWSLVDNGMGGSYAPPSCHLGSTQPLTWRWYDDYPVFYELDSGVEVRLRGLLATLGVGGTVEGDVGEEDRLAAIPQQVATGADSALAPLADMALSSGSFQATLTEAPSADYDSSGDPDWRFSMSLLLRYADDGDGQWTLSGDGEQTTLQSACDGRRPAYVRYTREVSTWVGMRLLDCYEGQAGWRLVTLNEATRSYTYLNDRESQALGVSETCSF